MKEKERWLLEKFCCKGNKEPSSLQRKRNLFQGFFVEPSNARLAFGVKMSGVEVRD